MIEYDLPLAEISRESAKEKNIRHGHPSTLHIWWAQRYSDDYWLYIATTYAGTSEQELQRIKNPGMVFISAILCHSREGGNPCSPVGSRIRGKDGSLLVQTKTIPRNPVVHFQMDEDIFTTGYIIPEYKWQANMYIDNRHYPK